MQFTVKGVAESLNIPFEQADSARKEAGIVLTEDRPLTEAEARKLMKLLAFRRYTLKRPATPVADERQSATETPVADERQSASATPVADGRLSATDELAQNYFMMIDTCSLMHDKCGIMMEELIPALRKARRKLIVPNKVKMELEKLRNDASDPARAASALEGLNICQKLLDADCLSIRGGERDNFADNVFFVYFSYYRDRYRLLLITQDRSLTHDILQLNGLQSSDGYPVKVAHITRRGKLEESKPDDSP